MEAYKICPQCGTHNDPQSGLCTKCQKTLVDVPASPTAHALLEMPS